MCPKFPVTCFKACVFVCVQLDVLEEVVKAVRGRCDVYMDGGVRRGTDILKALALGAKGVFIGRPVLWGLACQVKLLCDYSSGAFIHVEASLQTGPKTFMCCLHEEII